MEVQGTLLGSLNLHTFGGVGWSFAVSSSFFGITGSECSTVFGGLVESVVDTCTNDVDVRRHVAVVRGDGNKGGVSSVVKQIWRKQNK